MSAQQQEKPMRHVMVFTRAFRAPLQATFSVSEDDSLRDLCQLLEQADRRTRKLGERKN
jgi:hypothetical protein